MIGLSDVNIETLKSKMDDKSFARFKALANEAIAEFMVEYVTLCEPDSIYFCDDSEEDSEYIRNESVRMGEEKRIGLKGQTIHFDGYYDQARDTKNTMYLLPEGTDYGPHILGIEREKGLSDVKRILKGIMKGKRMFAACFCLGPVNSPFSIGAFQLTDSPYVMHSERILYRGGYEQFKKMNGSRDFFRFIHSEGELVGNVCKNLQDRRIYMDLLTNTVFSTNTQYAGNTVGLKKLALRLAIQKSNREDWLTEHMLLMGVSGRDGRKTYISGAFPSACGKTSTAMLPGENIVGDDIVYLRILDGAIRAVNVENGIFGIIQDVNAKDDPLIHSVISNEGETIFSNVCIDDKGFPHWLGDKQPLPEKGINHSGDWFPGKKDAEGKEIPVSNKNARYTIPLARLSNYDKDADNPNGVPLGGIVYGGRDSDTTVPVEQSFNWVHGIITKGASIESETTAATLGKEGVRKFNPMSNIEFLAVPMSLYLKNNIEFGQKVQNPPLIFGVNYFLRDKNGKYHNGMEDKRVWIHWAEGRIHGDFKAYTTPTGYIPLYEDLKNLFRELLGREYTKAEYDEQFTVRIPELLAKIDRIEAEYKNEKDIPQIIYDTLDAQRKRLEEFKTKFGEYILPEKLA